ncbi:DNA-processing protein DprA [Shewanella sp. AS1]|uniref:DNA-processing protein DprA n=1 Tax=Shewanella sp. AS1 TaxID=2907626 RepID=UPI001F2CA6D7|nr:DNA-processing protein DprA [Shewanella sp. AS1]MCE9680549.1 DNA-processing protein DprA [Shewanella sp. AS1]
MDVSELRLRLSHEPHVLPLPEKFLKASYHIDASKVEAALAWLDSDEHHHIITQSDPFYPSLLLEIPDPPPLLFVKGDSSALLKPSIAMVGSRAASQSGLAVGYQLSQELTRSGLVICSGMAAGIDGAAHQGALDAGGETVAVLGTGIEEVYPKRHAALYHKIQESGCVISEFWPDTKAFAGNFPKRNRIISGLSLGVLVVEATRKSGSLITARLALEQGREVFAVPGNILAGDHQGCHDLLRSGAKLVESAVDVIEELTPLLQFQLEELQSRHHIKDELASDLPFSSLLASVGYEITPLDVVVEHSGKTIELVLEQLLELELQGWVSAVPGGYVRLKRS